MDIILTQYSGAILGPIAKLLGWVMNGIYIVLDKIGIQDIGLTIIIFKAVTEDAAGASGNSEEV